MARKKKDESTEEIKKPKAIGPYDIIKLMFTDKESFDKLSNITLSKNFFMINRVMAIQFPLQAQCFNKLNIRQADVIKAWQQFAVSKCGFGRVPSFVYTKSGKSTVVENKDIDKELKKAYCLHNNISIKDLDEMLYFAYDLTLKDIKRFNDIFKDN